jgi:inhibitor of cysteine peptidase
MGVDHVDDYHVAREEMTMRKTVSRRGRTWMFPWLPLMTMALLVTGCGDAMLEPSDVVVRMAMVEEVFPEVVTAEPVRVELTVVGNFRDSCEEIDEITQSRDGTRFEVRMTTTRPVDAVCTQALVPFDETVVLMDTDDLAPGDYVVEVNDVTEEFTIVPASAPIAGLPAALYITDPIPPG